MTVEAVLSQTPGRGWRWSTVDTGVVLEQGLAYFSSSSLAEADAVRALGTNWPGTPSEDFDTVSDAEEDGWHYVGEAGEPAFSTTWANVSGGVKMAFRIRESGVVDIQGTVAPGTTSGVFVLPEDYRPSSAVAIPVVYDDSGLLVGLMNIVTNGTVQMPGTTGSYYSVNSQFFLNPPDIAP